MADEDKRPLIWPALAAAFWDVVQAYSDWTAAVPERTFYYKRKHRSMSEICQIVEDHNDPAPNKILTVLAHETRVSPGSLQGLTYGGAGRHLTRLIEMKKKHTGGSKRHAAIADAEQAQPAPRLGRRARKPD